MWLESPAPTALLDMLSRAKAGVDPSIGKRIMEIMRRGPGSVDDQFSRQALDSILRGHQSWPRSKDFGNRPAPPQTLQRSGRLRRAWMGEDSASISDSNQSSVTIGVRGSEIPAAPVQQTGALIIARRSTISTRRLTMQMFLGMAHGVWISAARLLLGLLVPARPVGISSQVMDRVGGVFLGHIVGVQERVG